MAKQETTVQAGVETGPEHGCDEMRPMREWPDGVISELLIRSSGPALASAEYEARRRRLI
jgi:hypothetical protein